MLKSLSHSSPRLSCGNLCSLGVLTVLALSLPTFYWVSSQAVLGQDGKGADLFAVSEDTASSENGEAKTEEKRSAERTSAKQVEYLPQPTQAEQRILDALEEETELQFTGIPLRDVTEFLAGAHDIQILIEEGALQEEALTADEPINLVLGKIRLESALRIMLKPLGMTYIVEDDVMKITTRTRAEASYVTRIYPVGDLCKSPRDLQDLVNVIMESVGSGSWSSRVWTGSPAGAMAGGDSGAEYDSAGMGGLYEETYGGAIGGMGMPGDLGLGLSPKESRATTRKEEARGAVNYIEKSGSLVIKQTFDGHRQILRLLRDLRELQQRHQKN